MFQVGPWAKTREGSRVFQVAPWPMTRIFGLTLLPLLTGSKVAWYEISL